MYPDFDKQLLMAVAQQPFEASGNLFCKLLPVMYVDGAAAPEDDFPEDGEIFWMLTAQTQAYAQPGRLLVGRVEDAVNPRDSHYQVNRRSLRLPNRSEAIQVICVDNEAIQRPSDLVEPGFTLELPQPSTPFVMIQWRSVVYGPFEVSGIPAENGVVRAHLSTTVGSADAYAVPLEDVRSRASADLRDVFVEVSDSSSPRRSAYSLRTVPYQVLLGPGWQAIEESGPERLNLESTAAAFNRLAKNVLAQQRRKELAALIDDLRGITETGTETEELLDLAIRVEEGDQQRREAWDQVVSVLAEHGILSDERIQSAVDARVDAIVQMQSAELAAKVEAQLNQKQSQLTDLEKRLKDLSGRLQEEEDQRRRQLDQELQDQRRQVHSELDAEQQRIRQERDELGSWQRMSEIVR